jgi:hypothetical protein
MARWVLNQAGWQRTVRGRGRAGRGGKEWFEKEGEPTRVALSVLRVTIPQSSVLEHPVHIITEAVR